MSAPDQSSDPRNTQAWKALREHARHAGSLHLRDLLDSYPGRYADFSCELGDLCLDFSRARATDETLELLEQLAAERNLSGQIAALFAGEQLNNTEQRAALHTSLRAGASAGPELDGVDIAGVVAAERAKFLAFATAVRDGKRHGATGQPFQTVINIGIGGSDLGPRFVSIALGAQSTGPDVGFVAGLDGIELHELLAHADPASTLFIVCSKTFSTLETLTNAKAARDWLRAAMSAEESAAHFAAVSVNGDAMDDFGVADDARFALWDWVGGRYSVWSPVGLAAAIAIGADAFEGLLAGARAMDEHFVSAPLDANIPVLMGLLAVWHQNFLGLDQHVVLPYDERLQALPDYLQQLWMESLGKSVRRNGASVDYPTGASLWGNGGSSAQHSFAQWLHQGTAKATVDYIGTANGLTPALREAHLQSLANMIAQAEVLARGRQVVPGDDPLELHREHPGNRPSTVILLRELSPRALGALLAAYEHCVFVQSVIWGINPFDQYGVEQGKLVARQYARSLLGAEREKLPGIGARILDWQDK